jgi:drug/metabolite transporter, DME family
MPMPLIARFRSSWIFSGNGFILGAALLWSTSGVFTRIIDLTPLTIAFYRVLWAGIFVLPLAKIPKEKLTVRHWRLIFVMTLSFALMNFSFISSLKATTAANSIFLQYTAPIWMILGGVFWLDERFNLKNLLSFFPAMCGVMIIIVNSASGDGDIAGVFFGLVAGVAYAGVGLCLRALKDLHASLLTTINHLGAAFCLLPFVILDSGFGEFWRVPQDALVLLIAFGILQMGVPYLLFAFGLKRVPISEAALLTLIEPVANPLLTYLWVMEVPSTPTLWGGALILLGVGIKYINPRIGYGK